MVKFTCSVTIDKPKKLVANLFADPNNLAHYQDGFIKKQIISGIEGEEGAISDMYYKMNRREMVITETITSNKLPDYFRGLYTHKHMDNFMISKFKSINEEQTLYEAEIEYTEFRGIIPKLMAKFFPSMFEKQVQKWLDNFKIFAEKQ